MNASTRNDPPGKDWISRFDKEFKKKKNDWTKLSTSKFSKSHYHLGYELDALMAAFEVTGRKDYLDEARTYVNNVKKAADKPAPQLNDDYEGWLWEKDGKERPLGECCFWRYVTKLLRIIKETPGLYEDTIYKQFFDETLAFTEKNIWRKWFERATKDSPDHKKNPRYIYPLRTHMASHWAFIALNLSKLTADEAIKSQCGDVSSVINNGLRKNLHPPENNPDAYFWNATWNPDNEGDPNLPSDNKVEVQDVSHANHVISYIVESFEQGIFWTLEDIKKFANTLKHIVWKPANFDFFDLVNGTHEKVDNVERPGRRQSDGWVKLGRVDGAFRGIYDTCLKENDKFAKHGKQAAQLYANLALNEIKRGLKLISPAEGETLEPGKRHTITWKDKRFEGTVNIHYSTDNGNTWNEIASGTSNDGARGWQVPDITSNRCLVRIHRTDGSAEDVSGVFSIVRG
ncbi:MAG: hypothetical protein GTO45_08200 [Candidatus Aminicenantes bacterium]|nr:hypothetical protein [Candidatus Aminicenantes bacterium]NIM78813.1 hypothetical protein [Candidatus Aminicenantes bacterium]NIN18068.1 hypothetical protein [Candidatus Aminicenantes bacterium]NIN41967.1 hypothetical protein [Candidatus Aminicenantes bacterium]NIN84723.1 hypothetical protein [Candidatus Aminicenantes bacterium]